METIQVLVPDQQGLFALENYPHLRGILYVAGREPTLEQQQATVVVVGLGDVDQEVAFFRSLPRLRLIQTLNAGFDQWIDRLPPNVGLSNARGAHGRSTAEWVAAVLLAHYRDLTRFAQSQTKKIWDHRITDSPAGKRVAVLGAGDIASHIRRMLEAFDCRLVLVGRGRRDGVLSMEDFRAAQAEQDAIVLAVPVTSETRGLVDAGFLAAMKDGSVLINPGRGALVVTDALLAETRTGRLHAIVDVTDPEPLPPDHPLWTCPGVTITPHVAGATVGVLGRGWETAARQIDQFARGETPTNLVVVPPGWSVRRS
jgi:phosphoglycerate dehydrogenase-like enzyme